MRKLGTFILFSFLGNLAVAVLPPANNAIALSLGGAATTYLNTFAIEHNVGALAFSNSELALTAANRFGLTDYSNVMVAGNYALQQASVGFSYQISPLASYTQQKAQLAVSKKLHETISAGIAINFHQFSSSDAYYLKGNCLTFNAGLYYQVNEDLNVGLQIFNPNRSVITKTPHEKLPSIFRLGVDYALDRNIKVYADAIQATEQKLEINAGLELSKDQYKIRGGFGLNKLFALGFGWKTNQISIDVAATYHNQLGFSPALNIGYAF